jgi:hypothetical protein
MNVHANNYAYITQDIHTNQRSRDQSPQSSPLYSRYSLVVHPPYTHPCTTCDMLHIHTHTHTHTHTLTIFIQTNLRQTVELFKL